jgi:hypothetical protein
VHRLLVEEQQDCGAYVAPRSAPAAGAAVSATSGAAGSAVRSAAAAGTSVARVEILGRVVEVRCVVLVEGLVSALTRLLCEVLAEVRVTGMVPVSMLHGIHGVSSFSWYP